MVGFGLFLIMSVNLNFLTWNVTGVMSTASYLCDILTDGNIDICGISEHWLLPNNLHFLGCISSDYRYHAVCDKDVNVYNCKRKVGEGGVSILWHQKYDDCIVPLNIDSDRIVGIQFEHNPRQFMYFLQVYLPCTNHSISIYRECIDQIYDLLCCFSDKGIVILMGDFNARFLNDPVNNRDQTPHSGYVTLCYFNHCQHKNHVTMLYHVIDSKFQPLFTTHTVSQ